MKILFLSLLSISTMFASAYNLLDGSSCNYLKNGISYRDTGSLNSSVTLDLVLLSKKDRSFCQKIVFKKTFVSTLKLNSRDSSLLSFLFDEYLNYSIDIYSSSKIVKRLFDFQELKKLQKMEKEKMAILIKEMGFPISNIEEFSLRVSQSLTPLDIFCLDKYTVYYNQEIDKLRMMKEYAFFFKEYELDTKISNRVFLEIINIKIHYIDSLKKIFIISLSENM